MSTATHPRIHAPSIDRAQRGLLTITDELERLDHELLTLIDSLDGEDGPLPRELASSADAVRRDLLSDAVATLRLLGQLNDDGARLRQLAVAGASERLLAGAY